MTDIIHHEELLGLFYYNAKTMYELNLSKGQSQCMK